MYKLIDHRDGGTWEKQVSKVVAGIYDNYSHNLSGRIQDRECMQHPGTCGAPTYLQGFTQGEWVPAECLSRSEKKAAFSSYSSPALYNGWVTQRKELNKKAVTHY